MSTCFDVAKYIFEKEKGLSATKLQKLVYYCQAWSIVWDDAVLFNEKIEAWVNGPVVRELYNQHAGKCFVGPSDFSAGSSDNLSDTQKETIEAVLKFYGDKNAQWLSDLTHNEEPWRGARKNLPPKERGNEEITLESMSEYYSSISENKI